MCVCVYLGVCAHTCPHNRVCVEVTGQFVGVVSLCLLCRTQAQNSALQGQQQETFANISRPIPRVLSVGMLTDPGHFLFYFIVVVVVVLRQGLTI